MENAATYYPDSYAESRQRFRNSLERIRPFWPDARLGRQALTGEEDLSIDWIAAEAIGSKEHLCVLTTGEHGIEGYAGAAMQQLFIAEYLPRLNPHTTGLLLVHALNPWGMQHRRRVNHHNVDLNRNFTGPNLDLAANPDYIRLGQLLNPARPVQNRDMSRTRFFLRLAVQLAQMGVTGFRNAVLMGQYHTPAGIYYGGNAAQEETETATRLYREHFRPYNHILHLDMHTGYGPRYQMSLVNSALEPASSRDLQIRFNYPLIVKANASEFYPILGDMIDYSYRLVHSEYPGKQVYAAAFEFGTLGDSLLASVHSLHTVVLENQAARFGVRLQAAAEQIQADFQELFYPAESKWRAKALADARQAFAGILAAEGLLSSDGSLPVPPSSSR